MLPRIKLTVVSVLLTLAFGTQPSASAQESTKTNTAVKTLVTRTFHGKVHQTSGRATIYQEADGKLVLRLTNFKTSNGPDVRVILIAAKDAADDANFLKSNTARVELGQLKANQGDQNYDLPDTADLSRYDAVVIYL
jgi:Electron transfer DM13